MTVNMSLRGAAMGDVAIPGIPAIALSVRPERRSGIALSSQPSAHSLPSHLHDRNPRILLPEILVARQLLVISQQALRRLIENIPLLAADDATKRAFGGQTLQRFS